VADASQQRRGPANCAAVGRLAHSHRGGRGERLQRDGGAARPGESAPQRDDAGGRGVARRVGDPGGDDVGRDAGAAPGPESGGERGRALDGDGGVEPGLAGSVGGVGDPEGVGREQGPTGSPRAESDAGRAGTGFWADFVLIPCRDGKVRRGSPKPEVFPLADGFPNRVGVLRGAGNAIVPQVAAEFVRAYLEVEAEGGVS
jgi:DNA (cytosine-5)-methyltransferase 1